MRRNGYADMMKRRAAVWLIGLSLLVPATIYVMEFLAVDDCLDHGGSFDYSAGRCDFAQNHSFVPFHDRHDFLLGASGAGLLIGVTTFAASRGQRRKTAA
jgi:hypothetical protein